MPPTFWSILRVDDALKYAPACNKAKMVNSVRDVFINNTQTNRTTAQSPMSFLASAQQMLCLRAWIFKWESTLCWRRVWSFPWSCQAAVWKLCSFTAVVLWTQRHYSCSSSLFEQLTPKAEAKNLALIGCGFFYCVFQVCTCMSVYLFFMDEQEGYRGPYNICILKPYLKM